ncbi:MAG: LLM class flavin-dependent oxidoreductase, partial [Nocardioides sp.]|uniref:LLM class flavin-dependent oxidoreductase n=1 Tax=Nocardioides sp. TaxID=35761 RepID=UPI003F10EFE7
LEFGVFVTPDAGRLPDVRALVQLADVTGLDLFTVQDHPYQERFVDAWTLLTLIGAQTSSVRLSPNVANLPLRPPVVLAKAAATLDLATGGRVELGLGAGAFWDAIVAAGGPRRTPGEAVEALTEAIELMKQFWQGGAMRFEGQHYTARGLHAGPVPAHDIPVMLGAVKPRMLRLTGRVADGWLPSASWATPDKLDEMNAIIDEAAEAAGRAPASVRRLYNVGPDLLGPDPSDWAERLAEITLTHGMSTFILPTDEPDVLQVWAEEVAPATRELVAVERGRRAVSGVSTGSTDGGGSTDEGAAAGEEAAAGEGAATGEVSTGSTSDATAEVISDLRPMRVQPTPDDGTRLVAEQPWDESTRPTYIDGTDDELLREAEASHFMDVHDHLRGELAQVRDILGQVRRGQMGAGEARSVINQMTLRQNNWTFGAYCESYCRMVTSHHTLEDRSVFPHLRRTVPGLAPVLDRLEEEHHVIHDVLDRFDRALVTLVGSEEGSAQGREALDGVQHHLDLLTDTLLSHFAYEERELLRPMARAGLQ